ncbi:uncharacterized protein LOC135472479 [Liolophura sinensis]|uniref:uncharacterized protein LOC135472479 n=1 Tax=Liolophura sinensis TaxID=3198878 RepID=UPI003158C18C
MSGELKSGVGTANPLKIFANLFISFIGAGVLGLPYAFKEAGIIEGAVIMAVVGALSVKAMLLLIDCKYRLLEKQHPSKDYKSKRRKDFLNGSGVLSAIEEYLPEDSVDLLPQKDREVSVEEPSKPVAPGEDIGYGSLGYYAFGRTGLLIVDAAIVISQTGFVCAYLIFISENLSDYLHGMKLIHWLLILLPPLYLLTLLRHLSSLAISSMFAQMSIFLAFSVVFWFDFEHFHNIEIHPKKIRLKGFPFFLAIAMYCYEGQGLILNLEASVSQEIRHKFRRYFIITLAIVTVLYISFGMCGYMSFGVETNAIITLNLPKGESLDIAMIVKSCLCLALFFTYPVMIFPVVKILEGHFLPSAETRICAGNVLRLVLVLLTGCIVSMIPNFAHLMALIGATCCSLLAFVLPGAFHLKLFKGSLSKSALALDIFFICLGIVGAILGTWDALKRLGGETEHVHIVPLVTKFNETTGVTEIFPGNWSSTVTV